MARSFVQLRGVSRYNQYQFHFLLMEASNLLTLMAQIMVSLHNADDEVVFWLYVENHIQIDGSNSHPYQQSPYELLNDCPS